MAAIDEEIVVGGLSCAGGRCAAISLLKRLIYQKVLFIKDILGATERT